MSTQQVTTKSLEQRNVEAANKLLDYLVTYAKPVKEWTQSLTDEGFKHSEIKTAIARVKYALAKQKRKEAIGIWLGGTGSAYESAGLDSEPGRWAILVLKEHNRIIQLGKGRGRAIAVIDPAHIDEPQRLVKVTETSSDKDTIEALRDEIAMLRAELEQRS